MSGQRSQPLGSVGSLAILGPTRAIMGDDLRFALKNGSARLFDAPAGSSFKPAPLILPPVSFLLVDRAWAALSRASGGSPGGVRLESAWVAARRRESQRHAPPHGRVWRCVKRCVLFEGVEGLSRWSGFLLRPAPLAGRGGTVSGGDLGTTSCRYARSVHAAGVLHAMLRAAEDEVGVGECPDVLRARALP